MEISIAGLGFGPVIRPDDCRGRLLVSIVTSTKWPRLTVPHTLVVEDKFRHKFRGQDTFNTTYEILQPSPRAHTRTYHFRNVAWDTTEPMQARFARLRVFFYSDEYTFTSHWTAYIAVDAPKPIRGFKVMETNVEVVGGGRYEWAVVNGRLP